MKVAVRNSKTLQSRRLTVVLALAFVLTVSATIATYAWLDHYLAQKITSMGGVADPDAGITANFRRIWSEALDKQRAAADAALIPELRIDIRRKNVGRLARKRNEALQRGYLIQESDDFVDVEIAVRNGEQRHRVKAKLRLKGDFTDHIKGEKWSFRVKTDGDDEILGMRVFSIQHPKVRGYVHENLFMEHMRREGILAPRYEYVRVYVNGRDKGIMALEEHFAKELLESQQRRESVIVRFDETLKWRTLFLMGQEVDFSAPYPLITPFQPAKIEDRPDLARDLDAAIGLMRGFLSKTLPPSKVFDPALTARFLAVAEIWGAEHALAWNNMRFYYNPITGLLEPVAFDANLQDAAFQYIPTVLVSVYRLADPVTADWLEDPAIREPFLRELQRISTEYCQPATWERVAAREQQLHRILHAEFPLIPDIQFGFYNMRAQRLRQVDADNFRTLPLMPPNYPVLMHAFLQPDNTGYLLELYNLVPYRVEVQQLTIVPGTATTVAALPLVLPPTLEKTAPTPTRIPIRTLDTGRVEVDVTAMIQGYPTTKTVLRARHYSSTFDAPVLPDRDWAAVLADQPGLRRDGNTGHLGPGTVHIRSPLVLPKGASLTVAPGTQLLFGTNGMLLVRGVLDMRGTAEAPIELQAAQADWHGVAVLDAGGRSHWSHVRVHRTRGLQLGHWSPTGSVMFYQSPVTMTACRFTDNFAEDAINLFRSEFALQDVSVERCTSDAIDMDFCTGTVRGGRIADIGGDGIDVSGTTIDIRDVRFERIKDKALSAGEASAMTAAGIQVHASGTGLASKDASRAEISDSTFAEMRVFAVVAFTKKPEYGPATVVGKNLSHDGSGRGIRAQIGSSVQIDGKPVAPEELDVQALYTTGPMNKRDTRPGSKGR